MKLCETICVTFELVRVHSNLSLVHLILTSIRSGIFAAVSCCTKYPIVGFIHVCIENEEKRLPQIPINCVSPFDVHERTLRTAMRSQQPHSHTLTKRIFQLCDALIDIPWAMLSRTEHMAMCLRFKCILYIMNPEQYTSIHTIQYNIDADQVIVIKKIGWSNTQTELQFPANKMNA